jgi:hypothetical protein
MKIKIDPYICLNDFEYMDNYSKGWHSHGGERIEVEKLSIGYPVADWRQGEVRQFPIERKKYTVGELFRAINKVVVDEIAKDNNYAPHCADDYCIEHVIITDGVAQVQFGS